MKKLFIILILIFLFSFLFVQQNNLNSGWRTFFKDALIAVQIDQYPNWKNLPELGLPKHKNGESVAPNTYARIALATVGLRLLAQNPYGIGVVRSLPESMKEIDIQFSDYVYTHSAWIDLGLAYGVIGMLIPISILILLIVINFFRKNTKNKSILILFSSNFLMLYFIGEYAFQHGIEILFYFISFISFSSFFHQPQVKSHL